MSVLPDRVLIQDIARHVGQKVTLAGWLYNRRSSGKVRFILLRDGTEIIQVVVFKDNVSQEVFDLSDRLGLESSIIVKGTVRQDVRSPLGYEIDAENLELIQEAVDYPITKKEHGVDFLMDHRHLWIRSRLQHAALRVRAAIIKAIRDYFDSNGFTLIDTPIFTPNACEGTTTLFGTEYFGEMAYLTQSGQLYNEANAMAFNKVYCFGPTFRAEKSKTRRHLTEFWMVEPEVAFIDLDQDMDLAEDFLCYVVSTVLKKCPAELATLERDTSKLEDVKKPFPRIMYDEAVEILKRANVQFEWGNDFGGDEETVISEQFDRPVMVHRYPAKIKPFYMKNDPQRPELALGVDVLAPEGYGEIIGGGQREDDHGRLVEKMKTQNLPMEAYQWYLDIRRYGSAPHSGFGLGVERTVAWICGIHHIRETIPYPRTMTRIYP